MKIRTHSVITLLCAAMASLLIIGSSAQAGYIVTLQQVGPNVVATGSGPIDLTGLSFAGPNAGFGQIVPGVGLISTGLASSAIDVYTGFSGPTNFGTGSQTFASSSSGDLVGIFDGDGFVLVPGGYVSGTALSDSSTYDGATFSGLGVTPGTFKWTWGTGANQNFTLKIGAATAPDQGSSLTLLSIVLLCWLGFDLARRRVIKA